MANDDNNATAPEIAEILQRLGLSREQLKDHVDQMRSFLQNQATTSNAAVSQPNSASTVPALIDGKDSATPLNILEIIAKATGNQRVNLDASTPNRLRQRRDSMPSSSSPLPIRASSSPFGTPIHLRDHPLPVTSPVTSSSPYRLDEDHRPLAYRLPPPPYSAYKPPFSYAALIGQAILASPDHRLSLGDIYQYIMTAYPFYQKSQIGWQNSIRHNLSLNPCFKKIDKMTGKEVERSTKGSLWAIGDEHVNAFEGGGFKKPAGMPYLGAKRRANPNPGDTSITAKRAKLSHSTGVIDPGTSSFSTKIHHQRAPSIATSSTASSPPPSSIGTASSSSSLPDLTNSSSSPPDEVEDVEEDEDEESQIPINELDDVFLSNSTLRPAPFFPSARIGPTPSKGADLLSRVIEGRSTPSPRQPADTIDNPRPRSSTSQVGALTPGPAYPQSHLRTPTRGRSTSCKMEDVLETKRREMPKWNMPVTPHSRTPPRQAGDGESRGLLLSPEKTPIDFKSRGYGKSGNNYVESQSDSGDETKDAPSLSRQKAKSVTPPPAGSLTAWAEDDRDNDEQAEADVTPKRTKTSNVRTPQRPSTSTTQTRATFTPRRLVFPAPGVSNPKTPVPGPTKKQFSPSLFTTPLPHMSTLHPPLFDPYDTPAALADELNRLENPNERGYGESPGSFFGVRRGLLYESPIAHTKRASWADRGRWTTHEDE